MLWLILKNKDFIKTSLNLIYSRNNLPRITDGEFVRNIDKYKLIRTRTALYVNGDYE